MKKVIYGAPIVTEEGLLEQKAIVFSEKIEALISESEAISLDAEMIKVDGGYLSPGFVDIHIHGAAGFDTMDGNDQALAAISHALPACGTTSFLPTTMTMPQSAIEQALAVIRAYMQAQATGKIAPEAGAEVLGAHMEGPFINPKYKGAQDETFIQAPTVEWVKAWLDVIRVMTLAPEMDEDFKTIRALSSKLVLSIGHSGADYDTANRAIAAGASHITHCFNAMTPLKHREPGIVGAALLNSGCSLELITDNIHVHPDLYRLVFNQKGLDRCILITDAMRAALMPEGEYDLGGQAVTVSNGCCTLADGTIAGSVHRTDKALQHVVAATKLSLPQVIGMLSWNPARKIGFGDRKGLLAAGFDADILHLNAGLEVAETYLKGARYVG